MKRLLETVCCLLSVVRSLKSNLNSEAQNLLNF